MKISHCLAPVNAVALSEMTSGRFTASRGWIFTSHSNARMRGPMASRECTPEQRAAAEIHPLRGQNHASKNPPATRSTPVSKPSTTGQIPPAAQKRQKSDSQSHAYYRRRACRDGTQNGIVQGAEGAQRQVRRFDQVCGKGSKNGRGVSRPDRQPRQDAPYGADPQEQSRFAGGERDVWIGNRGKTPHTSRILQSKVRAEPRAQKNSTHLA